MKDEQRAAEIEEAVSAVTEILGEYAASVWGDVLKAFVSAVVAAKIDAAEIEQEEAAKRALLLTPGTTVDLTEGNTGAAAEG